MTSKASPTFRKKEMKSGTRWNASLPKMIMKTKNLFVLPALIAVLNLPPAGRVTAQTFTALHSFTGGSDGVYPKAGLILSGDTLYGTAVGGGSAGNGTVFALNIDGTGFRILHSFTATSGYPHYSNSDGASPLAGLILSGDTLYGTAYGLDDRRRHTLARSARL